MTESSATQNEYSYSSACIEDAATQAAMQPWVMMECYQLSQGKQLARVDTLDLGRQQVVRETQLAAVHKLGMTPASLCTVSCSTPDINFRFSDLGSAHSNPIFFMPELTEFDIYVPAGTQTAYISFNYDDFLRGAQALDPARWERQPQQLLSLCNGQQPALMAAVTEWLQYPKVLASTAPAYEVNEQILQQFLLIATATDLDHTSLSPADRAQAYFTCRKAREYIESCFAIDRIPTISAICIALGISERRLQYAFRAYVDMSPLAYLRSCRLCRVRTILRYSCPTTTTVTSVAMRFGFFHLGRFARDYKQAFDEHPSRTLHTIL